MPLQHARMNQTSAHGPTVLMEITATPGFRDFICGPDRVLFSAQVHHSPK